MQRPIKFRVWDHLTGEMTEAGDRLSDYLADDRYSVMQFTGLRDKNGIGIEIYEGDIVSYTGFDNKRHRGICYWEIKGPGFRLKIQKGAGFSTMGNHPEDFEVIGNIYENGELVGKYPDSFTSEKQQATHE
jgi:uncharacterized phage protein (TIGR01671 family)